VTPTSDDAADLSQALTPHSRTIMREVAHLLRSPLGSIVMLADTMRSSTSEPLTDAQRRKLGIIHRAALGVAATMGDLLTLVGEGEDVTRTARFSVPDVLEVVADIVRPVTEARENRLDVRPAVARIRHGPTSALSRALLGLTLLGASRVRGGAVEISATEGDGDMVTFSIVAAGEPDSADAEPVQMLRALRRDPESGEHSVSPDGLRLSGARALVRRIGSDLHVTDEDGALRLTFTLALPVAG
jgi:signal transduction histidine kinase